MSPFAPLMPDRPRFLFATCQVGAEGVLKRELGRRWPEFRLAFSRPGFLTLKLPAEWSAGEGFDLESVFAQAWGSSLGRVGESAPESVARAAWELCGERAIHAVHVWRRSTRPPEQEESRPAPDEPLAAVRAALVAACPRPKALGPNAASADEPARRGGWVLDCVLVDPGQWWIGCHRAESEPSRYAGGRIPLVLPADAVSRAWLKMEEALRWSRLPIPRGARCAELGSAPGGASQALLARGVYVLGVDPAEMDPTVLAHPDFTHLRRRVTQTRRREFRKVRWLTADMNVAPGYTLEAVEAIVTHPMVNVRGLLMTLKLFEWELADQVPEYLDRVRSWGYNRVQARQLGHNRQEVCVAALQKPFVKK